MDSLLIEDHTKELTIVTEKASKIINPKGTIQDAKDRLIHEHFLEVSINGYVAFRLSCTAEHLKELVIGRLYTEGLIRGLDDMERLFLCAKGNIAEVTLKEGIPLQPYDGNEPTCCTGNRQYLSNPASKELQRLPDWREDPDAVFEMAGYFQKDSKLHRSTSGTHSCYIYLPDDAIVGFEDISRHNALDKAVGHMLLTGAAPEGCMLYTTGRVPVDMAEKVIRAGVPVLVSKSVPTDAAVDLAAKYNLTLICKAWPDSYTEFEKGEHYANRRVPGKDPG